MRKIRLIRSIATSFAALITAFYGVTSTQNVVGHNDTINSDIVNAHHNPKTLSVKGKYFLKNKTGSVALVVSSPSFTAASNPQQHVCTAISGTPISLTGEKSMFRGLDMWRKVKINDGECKGKEGWATLENISYCSASVGIGQARLRI